MRRSLSPVLWFFVFAYVITGVGMCVNFLAFRRLPGGTPINSQTLPWLPYAPYVLWAGPCLASLLMTLFLYGLRGVGRLAFRLSPWSVGRAWPVLAVCLLLPLGVAVLPVKILAALAVSVPHMSWEGWPHYLYGAVIGQGLIGPGLFEEIGWRGFALPHLQRRYSALVSSLIIGLVWAFWHFPNFFFFTPSMLAVFVPMGIVMSVIYTWVYNSTGGSLFAVVVLHGATIASGKLFAGRELFDPTGVITGLLFVVIAVWLVWRYGAANLSWRDRVVAQPPNQGAAANARPAPSAQTADET
jgi:membrane protease YdiL (CAAX protease family)